MKLFNILTTVTITLSTLARAVPLVPDTTNSAPGLVLAATKPPPWLEICNQTDFEGRCATIPNRDGSFGKCHNLQGSRQVGDLAGEVRSLSPSHGTSVTIYTRPDCKGKSWHIWYRVANLKDQLDNKAPGPRLDDDGIFSWEQWRGDTRDYVSG